MIATAQPATRKRADAVQFRFIYLSTMPAFLLGAMALRLLPARLRRASAGARLSVFGEARAAARTCGSFALMG